MRVIRFIGDDGAVRYGADAGDGLAEVLDGGIGEGFTHTGRSAVVRRPLAPLEPCNIFCVGLNYRAHARETGAPMPDAPVLFMKPTTSIIGPGEPIPLPRCARRTPEVDYEGELAVIIGRRARDVPEAEALSHVAGYTIANDVSARRWQRANGGQWVRGKSFDGFCPLGPGLVTADEIRDPQSLHLTTTLNGEIVQEADTSDMIFPVARLISFISQDTTLLPGTLILTGTPAGVGFIRRPPVYLRAGDRVAVEIEPVGTLANPVA